MEAPLRSCSGLWEHALSCLGIHVTLNQPWPSSLALCHLWEMSSDQTSTHIFVAGVCHCKVLSVASLPRPLELMCPGAAGSRFLESIVFQVYPARSPGNSSVVCSAQPCFRPLSPRCCHKRVRDQVTVLSTEARGPFGKPHAGEPQ